MDERYCILLGWNHVQLTHIHPSPFVNSQSKRNKLSVRVDGKTIFDEIARYLAVSQRTYGWTMWMNCVSFLHAWRHERVLESLMFFNVDAAFKPLLICQFRALQFLRFLFLMLCILPLIQLLPNSVKEFGAIMRFRACTLEMFCKFATGQISSWDCIANLPGSSPICEPSPISCLVMAEPGFRLVSSGEGFVLSTQSRYGETHCIRIPIYREYRWFAFDFRRSLPW